MYLDTAARGCWEDSNPAAFCSALLDYLIPLALASDSSKAGNTNNAKISERATEAALTKPKSCITGTGDNSNTKKPDAVVKADIMSAVPVIL